MTRWRVHVATVALDRGARVTELARRLGCDSEAAFSRAYKRVTGVPPATVRGRASAPTDPAAPAGDPPRV